MPSKLTRAQRLKKEILNHLGIVFASIFFAAGYSWFLLPYNMAPGGSGGYIPDPEFLFWITQWCFDGDDHISPVHHQLLVHR